MTKSFAPLAASVALLIAAASAASVPDGTWPTSTGTVTYTEPYTIKAGEVFDGKMQTFDRSDITCSEGEGQKDTAVFLVEAGGTLKNAIIGKNQKEGVHCDDHDCTIENVWWDDVCEDALSIKGGSASSVTTVTNCGARYASDKVVQHNGYGTVKIDGFYAQEFGKLYRSCGTCGDIPRKVFLSNVYAVDPLVSVVTVNKNYGDQAKFSNIYVKTSDGKNDVKVCQWSQGSKTPSNLGDGPSGTLCQYSESDVHINKPLPTTTAQTASSASTTTETDSSVDASGAGTVAPAGSFEESIVDFGSSKSTEQGSTDESANAPSALSSSSSATTDISQTAVQQSSSASNSSSPSQSAPTNSTGSVPDGKWPTSKGTVRYAQPYTVKSGEIFDGKMKTFERSDITCEGQTESGSKTAVFLVEAGGTLKNNYNDQAKLTNIHVKSSKPKVKVCQWSQGGSSPKNLGDGPSGTLCQYSESDIHINE
ncbi:hypothetical protein BBJ29_008515 [Phytophthora kernoviae]|uniref:Probable pectate lyase F n=1 Tax=Phytophthora kernoviae TaxID=325452 RepID=A0A421G942_9STRA|nr:hypothetical protein BBJ29_008515 [Phytophthora kernoviae]